MQISSELYELAKMAACSQIAGQIARAGYAGVEIEDAEAIRRLSRQCPNDRECCCTVREALGRTQAVVMRNPDESDIVRITAVLEVKVVAKIEFATFRFVLAK